MEKDQANKIIEKSKSYSGHESFGFKRYMALPDEAALNMKKAHLIEGEELSTFVKRVTELFGGMTEDEYRNWLLINA